MSETPSPENNTEKLKQLAHLLGHVNSIERSFYKGSSKFEVVNGTLIQSVANFPIPNDLASRSAHAFYTEQMGKLGDIAFEKNPADREQQKAVREAINTILTTHGARHLPHSTKKGNLPVTKKQWDSGDSDYYYAASKAFDYEEFLGHFQEQMEGVGRESPVGTFFQKRLTTFVEDNMYGWLREDYKKIGLPKPSVEIPSQKVGQDSQHTYYYASLKFDSPFDIDRAIANAQEIVSTRWTEKLEIAGSDYAKLLRQAEVEAGWTPEQTNKIIGHTVNDQLDQLRARGFSRPDRGGRGR